MKKLHRFFTILVVLLLTSALGVACAQEEREQYDIVIVGSGVAGMSAAINAYDAGDGNIVVLETQAFAGGGSSKAYGGIYSSTVSYETDPTDDGNNDTTVEEFFEAGMEASAGADEAIQRLYAEHAHDTLEWLNDLGYRWGTIHYTNLYRPSDGSGVGNQLTKVFLEQLTARGIEIRYNTTATRILTDDDGVITGVAVDSKDRGSYELATGCVVLATGGYANNPEMLAAYNPEYATAYANNNPGSRGQGLIMAQELGAKIVNMENLYVFETVEPDNIQNSVPYDLIYRGVIFVNQEGQRFTNEASGDATQIAIDTLAQPDATIYAVFNDRIYREFLEGRDQLDLYDTLYLAGLENSRNLVSADTLEELGERIGIDGSALAETIADIPHSEIVNDVLLEAVDTWASGPYYAIRETSAIGNTLGGLVVDTQARVYDVNDRIIAGLYAAGEVTGNTMVSDFYYGLTDAVIMGKQAGIESVEYVKGTTGITEHQDLAAAANATTVTSASANYEDGVYEGVGNGLNGEIQVKVTVADGRIAQIEVLRCSETETLFEGVVNTMVPEIIAGQQLDIDTVTGATFASNGFMEAVTDALDGMTR